MSGKGPTLAIAEDRRCKIKTRNLLPQRAQRTQRKKKERKTFGRAKFLIQDLTPISFLLILLMLLSPGCATHRLEPNAATEDILVRVIYESAGCEFRIGEIFIVYKNHYCRMDPRGKPIWFKLSDDEYNKIASIVLSQDLKTFYDNPDNRAKANRATLLIRFGNDPICPNGFDDSHAICLDDGSKIPDSISQLMKELRIIVINHKGPNYWLIN